MKFVHQVSNDTKPKPLPGLAAIPFATNHSASDRWWSLYVLGANDHRRRSAWIERPAQFRNSSAWHETAAITKISIDEPKI
jgi:hypothetical protein